MNRRDLIKSIPIAACATSLPVFFGNIQNSYTKYKMAELLHEDLPPRTQVICNEDGKRWSYGCMYAEEAGFDIFNFWYREEGGMLHCLSKKDENVIDIKKGGAISL